MDRLIVQVRHGQVNARELGERRILSPGQEISIGRDLPADWVLSDEHLSTTHLHVKWTGRVAFVRDLKSRAGTTLNGEPIPQGGGAEGKVQAPHGAWIQAGMTAFGLFHESETLRRRPELKELSALASRAFHELSRERFPLYGVLDGARDARILPLVRESVDEQRILLEGIVGRTTESEAPHLVRFADDSELLRTLVGLGWGQRFGIFCTSPKPFEEVRRHFRRLLLVTDDDTGEKMFFRFYDPAVLRAFLPAATGRHREMMFGPLDAYLVESPAGATDVVTRYRREEWCGGGGEGPKGRAAGARENNGVPPMKGT